MKCFSLFSGIGGFDLALKNLGHEIVGACEIDKYARQIYERHFPGVRIWEDATKLNPEELPDFNILTAGFPCQAFSIAGKRLGFEESRGTLFHEIARIAKQKRPGILLLENVRGLLSHDGGKTFETIITTLDDLGYDVEWQVINSKYFVPQNRERVFIIGHLRGSGGRKIFPIGEFGSEVDTKKLKQIANIDTKGHNSLWGRVYDPNGISSNLNAEGGGLGAKTGLYAIVNDKGKIREVENSTAIDSNYWKGADNHAQRTMIAWSKSTRDWGVESRIKVGEANTLSCGDGCGNQSTQSYVLENIRIRRLTPKECERLQGFPDDWTLGNSDTQRYRGVGNAVTVPVIEYIASKL